MEILTCTCVGVHQGKVEPPSQIEVITSSYEALQVRRSCASPARHFHQVLSPLCVTEDSRPGEGFLVCLDCGSLCLQLASSWPAPREQKKVSAQLTIATSCSRTKPMEPSLHEHCRYTCKADAAPQLYGWLGQTPPIRLRRLLVLVMSHNRRSG